MHVLVTKGKNLEKHIENHFFGQNSGFKTPETTAIVKNFPFVSVSSHSITSFQSVCFHALQWF